jgi:hypothetical protein
MNTEEKVMLGVGIAAVTVLGAVAIYEASKSSSSTTTTPATPAATTPNWIEVTGQTTTMPVGSTIAMSYMAPSAAVVTELEGFANLPATQATNVGIYPVGTPAPAGFPNDGAGTNAFRITAVLAVATPPLSNAQALRTWYHT